MERILCIFILLFCAPVYAAATAIDITPFTAYEDGVKVVFSSEEAVLAPGVSIWPVTQEISFLNQDNYISKSQHKYTNIAHTHYSKNLNISRKSSLNLNFDGVYALFEDLSDPFYDYFFDNTTDMNLYMDVSSVLISHLVRHATSNLLDLVLLSGTDQYNSTLLNGLELGIRPTQLFGFRVKIQDNESNADCYGVELELHPTDTAAVKFLIEDNNTASITGMQLNYQF